MTQEKASRRRRLLLPWLLVAMALRLSFFHSSPEGLQVDEASNLWNSECIAKSGYDEHQQHFPIFYTQAFGDNRSALFLYFLIPFEAIFGDGVVAAHIAAGFFGVVAVGMIYYVGRRMLGETAGIIAAALLSLNPWHIQETRWAHEATISPLLVLLSIASWLWAGLP